MIIESRIRIEASPVRVYDLLVDPDAWFRVDPTLVEVTPRTPLSIGSTGTLRNRRGGLVATATWTTTELVRGERITQHLRGWGYEMTEAVTLEPDGDGTTMVVIDEVWPTSLAGRLMVATARGIMRRDLTSRCALLKAEAEAGGS
jgi:uncharacterized protein YndB with AHSA1/START domain